MARGGFEPPTQGFSVLCSTPELPRRKSFWNASLLSGEFVALGLNAITYYSTLRHLVLARLLVISKSMRSIFCKNLSSFSTTLSKKTPIRKAFFWHFVPKKCLPIPLFFGGCGNLSVLEQKGSRVYKFFTLLALLLPPSSSRRLCDGHGPI